MTPRVDVQALEAHATAADAANLTLATGLSRFPVYRDSLDEVIGTVHIRDVLALEEDKRAVTPVTELATEPLLVPRLAARRHGSWSGCAQARTMAVVIDEYGGTAGRGHRGGHRRGGRRRGPRRARPHRAAPTCCPRTGPGRPGGVGGGRQRPHRRARGDRLRRTGRPVRDPGRPGRHPPGAHPGQGRHASHVDGWRLAVLDVEHHRADRVRITAPGRRSSRARRRPDDHAPARSSAP